MAKSKEGSPVVSQGTRRIGKERDRYDDYQTKVDLSSYQRSQNRDSEVKVMGREEGKQLPTL